MPSLEAFGLGLILGITLGLPPGPIIAQMAIDTARGEPWKGLRVGLGAVTADGVFFLLVTLGILVALPSDPVLAVLALAGAVFMVALAKSAYRTARDPLTPPRRVLNGFPSGYLLATLSPFNIGWWLTAGTTFLALYGPTLAGGFFTGLIGVVFGYTLLFHMGARRIPRMATYVGYTSTVFLGAFALYLAYQAWTLIH